MSKLREALEEARDFIDNYQDTIDGEYGRPHPNKAMVIVQHIDASLRDDGWVSVKEPPQPPTPKPPRLGWLLSDGTDVWISHSHPSWWSQKGETSSNPDAGATHWRPLPEPPKEEK